MFNAPVLLRRALQCAAFAGCLSLVVSSADFAAAQSVDLSLNVFFEDPNNINSGGTWELFGKSSGFGLAGVKALLTDITTATLDAPRGTVNAADPAGFSVFASTNNPMGFREITVGQAPLPPGQVPPREQSLFYGVGTLINGAPNYPAKPPGTNSIGPLFTTLTNVQDVPWAVPDPFNSAPWNTAARLASGTFADGNRPDFFSEGELVSRGNVITTLGSSMNPGEIALLIPATTVVRTNFTGTLLPDYNDNGMVDAADYVLWRKQNGMTGPGLAADGNGDNVVNAADYNLWRANFGAIAGAGSTTGGALSTSSVPEPTGAALMAIGATLLVRRRPRR